MQLNQRYKILSHCSELANRVLVKTSVSLFPGGACNATPNDRAMVESLQLNTDVASDGFCDWSAKADAD